MKNKFTPKQKATVALSALRGEKLSNLSSLYQAHPVSIKRWKENLEENADILFSDKRKKENQTKDQIIDELYKIIGKRETEISWLKKKFNLELPRETGFD